VELSEQTLTPTPEAAGYCAGDVARDVPWEWTVWQAARWHRGKVVAVHSLDSRADALEAVGLSE
jgi:hypothetical protein